MAISRNFDNFITRVQLFQKPEHTDTTAFTCYKDLLLSGNISSKESKLIFKKEIIRRIMWKYNAN